MNISQVPAPVRIAFMLNFSNVTIDRLIWLLGSVWEKRWLYVGLCLWSFWLFRFGLARPFRASKLQEHLKRKRVSIVCRERRRRLPRVIRDDAQFRFSVMKRIPILLDCIDNIDDESDKVVDTLEEENLKFLKEKVPESTVQERRRFLDGRLGNRKTAARDLKNYFSWMEKYKSLAPEISDKQARDPERDEDIDIWNRAASLAMKSFGCQPTEPLQRVIRTFTRNSHSNECCDKEGNRLFAVHPAIMDERLAPLTVYSLALAIYLDQKLFRDSTERITLLIDVRPGQGWRNLHATKLVSFMSDTFKNLISKFPERLAIAMVFPFPSSFRWIWSIVKQVLDQDTAQRIMLLTGTVQITSPPPTDEMIKVIDGDVIEFMESERCSSFKC